MESYWRLQARKQCSPISVLKRFPSLLCEEYIGETESQLRESKEANAIVLVRTSVTGISGWQQQQGEESLLF